LHLDRDQFALDELANGVLKKTDIVRKIEIHSVAPVDRRATLGASLKAVNPRTTRVARTY
jgi:hypothetical protein